MPEPDASSLLPLVITLLLSLHPQCHCRPFQWRFCRGNDAAQRRSAGRNGPIGYRAHHSGTHRFLQCRCARAASIHWWLRGSDGKKRRRSLCPFHQFPGQIAPPGLAGRLARRDCHFLFRSRYPTHHRARISATDRSPEHLPPETSIYHRLNVFSSRNPGAFYWMGGLYHGPDESGVRGSVAEPE